MNVDLKALVGKLNAQTREGLEEGARLCAANTHYDVEIEHFLVKLLEQTDNDVIRILSHFNINRDHLSTGITRATDGFKRGNSRTPLLGQRLYNLLREAWSVGSVDYAATEVRSGFLVLALCGDADLSRAMRESAPRLLDVPLDALKREFRPILAGSPESGQTGEQATTQPTGETPAIMGGKTPNLEKYTVDLTQRAKQGKIDPVLGRDAEIRQIVDILMRRRQNNPILTGEAGVGKTAVVEGFAGRVAVGDVPRPLRNVSVRSLDLALLQAGAGIKGEFENRLKRLAQILPSRSNTSVFPSGWSPAADAFSITSLGAAVNRTTASLHAVKYFVGLAPRVLGVVFSFFSCASNLSGAVLLACAVIPARIETVIALLRYRANACPPPGSRICALCGATRTVERSS